MLNKRTVYNKVKEELEHKIHLLQLTFDDLNSAVSSDSKSTAGDKHETGRAMLHLEQEKLSKQMLQFNQLQEALGKINPNTEHSTIQFGSLIHASNGYFFLSIGIGKITLGTTNVFCLSPTTPLGQQFISKKADDNITLNGQSISILSVQ